ncbi:hypothetical protein C1645_830176 [Glomus cerebriforme]|uniref:F-box domain-containing protein n=1 Tax=Glomus cerebriforme TaxID=658196 RepID=A0A397SP83_9GLOM|nr:hypothetical protein C1645_830176 [Glomus cerebriforme]
MLMLNENILYLIFKEFQDYDPSLHSCLLVNKIWCETIIPILWKNPWKSFIIGKEVSLLNVIISHLSDESKDNLRNKGMIITNQRPLFNYINFCKHLNLKEIERLINFKFDDDSDILILKNEIFKLLVNSNTKFTHLCIPHQFDQLHLILEAKHCFSELEFFSCNDDKVLIELSEICKPIKELELIIKIVNYNNEMRTSPPFLQILRARLVPVRTLISLIKNTSGYLTEIKIDNLSYNDEMKSKRIIQVIYQNCPTLKYLKLFIQSNNFSELKNLLINCQYLDVLYIHNDNGWGVEYINNWDFLFEILTKYSPTSLFKFKFGYENIPKLEQLKLFFDNWENRTPVHPMLLQTNHWAWYRNHPKEFIDLIDKYKQKGIVKKYEEVDMNSYSISLLNF